MAVPSAAIEANSDVQVKVRDSSDLASPWLTLDRDRHQMENYSTISIAYELAPLFSTARQSE
jgi:hypothetical protein